MEHLGCGRRVEAGGADPVAREPGDSAGAPRTTTSSTLFLVAHGAEAPYAMTALSEAFDEIDGPLVATDHAEAVTDLIIRGLLRHER